MDPYGPWLAPASNHRQPTQPLAHSRHQLQANDSGNPSTSQAFQNFSQPTGTGFLAAQAPPTYDTMFSPLFHQKSQYRAFNQSSEDSYSHTATSVNNFYEQSNPTALAWSQNTQLHSPFGVLPHESVLAQSSSVIKSFENLGHLPQTMNQYDYESRFAGSPMKSNPPFFHQTMNEYQKLQNIHF
ncbi:unnamed protein product [Nesidiocoris tenuis]|uniref:Uncharacterized protein n=1 Tax=Nesidiocoris tenuis TaxID=355587 RepID=A0A6H5GF11_9HEMI|nr:unnamed protein product [Nesidiocoris tenuis]